MLFLGLVDVDDRELRLREVRGDRVDRVRLGEADSDGQVIAPTREGRQVRDVFLGRLSLVDALVDAQLALSPQEPDVRKVVEATVVESADVRDETHLDLLAGVAAGRARVGR